MNRLNLTALLTLIVLIFTVQVYAASNDTAHGAMDHSTHQGHGVPANHEMTENHGAAQGHDMAQDHDAHASGMKIHTAMHDGYTMEYRLINMKDKMKNMKNMPQMEDTHHLMVFVKDPNGAYVNTAKVGYLIEEKGAGTIQKKMAMAMNNGFGADVTLKSGSHYQIKTKVMAGQTTLMDEFKYMGGDH